MEPRLVQKLKLLMQGRDVAMIPAGESPVLELSGSSEKNALYLVPVTVRFLRCGCLNVQWLVTYGFNAQRSRLGREIVENALELLKQAGESLVSVLYSVWLLGLLIGLLRYGMEDGVRRD